MFAIRVEVSDPWAEMVPFSAQKTFRQVEACPSFSATARNRNEATIFAVMNATAVSVE